MDGWMALVPVGLIIVVVSSVPQLGVVDALCLFAQRVKVLLLAIELQCLGHGGRGCQCRDPEASAVGARANDVPCIVGLVWEAAVLDHTVAIGIESLEVVHGLPYDLPHVAEKVEVLRCYIVTIHLKRKLRCPLSVSQSSLDRPGSYTSTHTRTNLAVEILPGIDLVNAIPVNSLPRRATRDADIVGNSTTKLDRAHDAVSECHLHFERRVNQGAASNVSLEVELFQ